MNDVFLMLGHFYLLCLFLLVKQTMLSSSTVNIVRCRSEIYWS